MYEWSTYHCRSKQREHFQTIQVCAARSHQVVPGRGREFGFPGLEVCARHGFGGSVGGQVHEAGGDVDVREEAEGEGEGDGVDGVVGGGCG